MGAVNVTNATGRQVSISNFQINNTQLLGNGTTIESGSTASAFYGAQDWNNFSDLNLDVTLNGTVYHINLNRGHYFSGGDCHYPGAGSDVSYVLLGTNSSGTEILISLSYRQAGAQSFIFSTDFSKTLDSK